MNNLHRHLAPISQAAWEDLEAEARRTLVRHLAVRRLVDVTGPDGPELAAVGTGHLRELDSPGEGVHARLRVAQPLVELRLPFTVSRQAADSVERGAKDADWGPVKEAARAIAYAEDRAVLDGFPAAGLTGLRDGSSHRPLPLPADPDGLAATVAQGLSELRLAGVEGPYRLLLGADAYTAASGAADDGYPVFRQLAGVLDGEVVWAPAVSGGVLLSTRGGDFELRLGEDLAIGYLEHDRETVRLYFRQTLAFLLYTPEAVVPLAPTSA